MPVTIIDGNLFDTDAHYIFHQVNCRGRMGSGIARQVRSRFPRAYKDYLEYCGIKEPDDLLGRGQVVQCGETFIGNLFAQPSYGYDGKQYTDYEAFRWALIEATDNIAVGSKIAMPYMIGCGLGGGDWETVYQIIEEELGPYYDVELWRWNDACQSETDKG